MGLAIADPLIGSTTPKTTQILEVTGQGEVSVAITLTEVQLGIKVQGKTATEVQQAVAQLSTAVVDVLQNLGAQELQTTSIQLNPVYSYENGTQTLTGFEGLNTLEFELPRNYATVTSRWRNYTAPPAILIGDVGADFFLLDSLKQHQIKCERCLRRATPTHSLGWHWCKERSLIVLYCL